MRLAIFVICVFLLIPIGVWFRSLRYTDRSEFAADLI